MDIIDNVISTEATRRNVRLMLPIMIHWAKTGQKEHTYDDLIHAIGKQKFSGIGYALMSQGLVNGIKNNAQFLVLRMIGE